MRRVRATAVGVVFALMALLTVGQASVSAQSEDDASGASEPRAASDEGTAPPWPFVGIVGLQYDPERESNVFVYWDSETGALSEVGLDQRYWSTYCPSEFSADRHRVFYSLDSLEGQRLEFVVPWGDDAYPVLHSAGFVDFYTSAEDQFDHGSDSGNLEARMQYSVLRVDNSQEVAYFSFLYDFDTERHGLALVDPQRGEQAFEAEPDDDERIWGTRGGGLGAAGFYYGFEVRYSEPACQAEDAYVVDGRTGELVACFHTLGGPSPVFVGPSSLATLELPEPFSDKVCDGFDLGKLDRSGAPEGAPD
ncbi:hypothetical protein [Candidatus Poriferisodalis sp.]|uniref:hypothetical protein n=1 Tax=Candidatus Poriferisodalis sp. TaxID=3101277 RepID=UPI003AF44BEF